MLGTRDEIKMTEDAGPSGPCESCSKSTENADALNSQRVFKKSSPNNKLTLYLSSRDLVVSAGHIDRLQGVLLVDPEFVEQKKVYGQVTLTFRYGREDEEVMGLKFCNEAIMCLAQLYPPHPAAQAPEGNTPLQEALLKRLGPNAYPFSMEITPLAPPSVQLVPAKEYNGAPIGTSYDVRAYVADRVDEKLHRRTTVRMGIRVVQRALAPPSPRQFNITGPSAFSSKRNKTPSSCKFGQEFKTSTATPSAVTEERRTSVFQQQATIEENEPPLAAPDENRQPNQKEDCHQQCEIHVNGEEMKRCLNEQMERVLSDHELQELDSFQLSRSSDIVYTDHRTNLSRSIEDIPPPQSEVEKPFLLSEGRIHLKAALNKAIYGHGEEILVRVHVRNNSNKTIKRIKVFVVQHVDVCMFSNGKFKNIVAMFDSKEDCPLVPYSTHEKTYPLLPVKSSTKNWIALEDSYTKTGSSLSSTVTCTTNNPDERNVFAIYVSYYVKIKLIVSVMSGEVSLKLPFTLMHSCAEYEPWTPLHLPRKPSTQIQLELKPSAADDEEVKSEKDGT